MKLPTFVKPALDQETVPTSTSKPRLHLVTLQAVIYHENELIQINKQVRKHIPSRATAKLNVPYNLH